MGIEVSIQEITHIYMRFCWTKTNVDIFGGGGTLLCISQSMLCISQSILVSRLLYADPTWFGFAGLENMNNAYSFTMCSSSVYFPLIAMFFIFP